tara:strand:- start:858 stop:1991 length:1134 start_codon:yes stop_codon:yes gene_type:complete
MTLKLKKQVNTNKPPNALILMPFVGINKIYTQAKLETISGSLASDRLQIKPLIQALNNLNYNISAASLNTTFQVTDLKKLRNFDLCIAGKIRYHESMDANQFTQFHSCCALDLKRKGAKLITIYSDHVAQAETIDSELYKNLLFLSDHIVTPSEKLKHLACNTIAGLSPTSIIEDPCLLPRQEFNQLNTGETIRLLWFGNVPNLKYLFREIQNLFLKSDRSKRYELTILTLEVGLRNVQHKYTSDLIRSNWSLRLMSWDIENQPTQLKAELSRAHITLLPSDPLDPQKNGVSHNRLIDSIQSGCIAIASPVDSYIELASVSLIGDNFPKLLNFAVANYPRLCNKYSKLRDAALQRFKPELNIKKWETAIQETMNSAA